MISIANVKAEKIIDEYDTNCISVTMGALSGKVIIVIIACISVVAIATIVIPIVVIYSGGATKNSTKVPTIITTTQTTPQTTTQTINTTTAESISDTTNGGGTVLAEFRCFTEGIFQELLDFFF